TISHLTKGLKKQGKLMIAHSDSRETINNLHKDAKSKIIHQDSLPTIEEISSLMERSGLKVIKTLDNNKMFYILGVNVS
ncbi:MAG: class I SAM-dependent methyltransferase, partial [Candidatus Lokiarchaeota archaeon]|nr:class I SAM-dependent methyltransferase [Candidatus Lokiarchaeota archaeon]